MTVGLIIGVGQDPGQEDLDFLIERGEVPEEGLQVVSLTLTADEAARRDGLRALYQGACVKQGWMEGLAFVDDLRISDLVVHGRRVIVVIPKTAAPEPLASAPPTQTQGGIIAGLGFTPSESDVQALSEHVGLRPDYQYILTSIGAADAASDVFLGTIYIKAAREHGWQKGAGGLSIIRRTVAGRDFIVLADKATNHEKAAATRASSSTKSKVTCRACGHPMESSDNICPHCGDTQWGAIVGMWLTGCLIMAAGIYAVLITHSVGWAILFWAIAAFGALILAVAISETVKAVRTADQVPAPQKPEQVANRLASGSGGSRGAKSDMKSLIASAKAGDAAAIRRALDADQGIASREDDDGVTLLHLAAAIGDTDIAAVLLDAGAAVDVRAAQDGWTPLHFAALAGQAGMATFLVKRGATIDAHGINGLTPIEVARAEKHAKVVAVLEKRGAKTAKPTAEQYVQEGQSAGERQDWPSSIESFTKALEVDSSCARAHCGLAFAYAATLDFDEARAHYKALQNLDPELAARLAASPQGILIERGGGGIFL